MSKSENILKNLTSDDWKLLEKLDSLIQSHTGSWGTIEGEGEDDDESEVFQMPYAVPDPLVSEFQQIWYDKGLVLQFDWSKWDEGREWYASTDQAKYDSLDSEMALKLLTAVIRNDRFNEGALMRAFESGDFPKIIHRFVKLRNNK